MEEVNVKVSYILCVNVTSVHVRRSVLAVWESLCRCESLCTCVRVLRPRPPGRRGRCSCCGVFRSTSTRLCVLVGFVTLTLQSQSEQTKHCIKILPTSLLCTKLLLDIILLNNKFVKYIFFNPMQYLGCVAATVLEPWGPGWLAAGLPGCWAGSWGEHDRY